MPVESFLVTALPYTADPASKFHVSLFVTHRLTPDGDEDPLSAFPTVVDWGEAVTGATVALQGSDGQAIPVTPLDQAVPERWRRVFPDDVPVRPWRTPELASVPWRTYPAHRMEGYARLAHTAAGILSPVGPPSLLESFLPYVAMAGFGTTATHLRSVAAFDVGQRPSREQLREWFEGWLQERTSRLLEGDPRGNSTLRALELLDEEATGWLDEVTAEGTLAPALDGEPDELTFRQAMVDLHRARRFYERPEEQRAYQERPTEPPADHERPPPPEPDFHQRCTLLADTPGLLRELGLVIDLHVDDLSRLQGLDWIRAELVVEGHDNPIGTHPAVTCHLDGTAFTTVSATGDYVAGALRLGDEDRYRVLDLDPDASSLKLERFVRSLPRLLYTALNGDPASAAPSALRSSGFAIARQDRADGLHDRLAGAGARDESLLSGDAAPLDTESVTRGLRLEVWDDVSDTWRSLHERLLDVEVDGVVVIEDEEDVGFLQGAALTRADEAVSDDPDRPYHAHEVVAGWEGWSLSVPPVGRTVVDETAEPVDQPDEQRQTPVAVRPRIRPGSLPFLRYGRSYAFRAWATDLAGNSPPPSAAGVPGPVDPTPVSAVAEGLGPGRARLPDDLTALTAFTREGLRATLPVLHAAPAEAGTRIEDLRLVGDDLVDRVVRARLGERAAGPTLRQPTRTERIERAVADTVEVEPDLIVSTVTTLPSDVLARALAAGIGSRLGPDAVADEEAAASTADLITTPRPFLRWDPVLPPAWVPRHPYTEGESLLTLVVRSGVEGDDDGGVAVTPPGPFATATVAAHPNLRWRGDSQRHLAAPKASQQDCERHGLFDDAFGPGASPDDRAVALARSLRESGTFLDRRIAHPADPSATVPQHGLALHHAPTTDPDALVSLDDIDARRGTPLAPGQYVVHDIGKLVLPYLPDPLAHGVALAFPDAGQDHRLSLPFATEGVTLPYLDDWPHPVPHRLVLRDGDRLGATVDGHVVTITLPPGERLRMRVSTCLTPDALDLLGLWRGLPKAFRDDDELAEAARDGWLWWLTPSEEVRLVHAVPRPVERPRVPVLVAERSAGGTDAVLRGVVDVHGPSTERLDVEGRWTEPVDDVAKPRHEDVARRGVAGDTAVQYDEDLVWLADPVDEDTVTVLADGRRIISHAIEHPFEDTRHRMVEYTVRATTRYREFFPPEVCPTIDDLSLVSEPVRVSVPSSARPAKPVVRDVLPLFRWGERTEPHQPFGLRRTRRAGLRLYLDRPWFSSGEGELLGVLLAQGEVDDDTRPWVSQWAADPVWRQDGPTSAVRLPLVDELDLWAEDQRDEPGRPVGEPADLPLVDLPDDPSVRVLGYRPEYSEERGLWFVDVAFDPGTAFWPFVRLAVARYQPESIAGQHLSPVVVCDFAQLAPERIATLTRPDAGHVRVVVTGAVGERDGLLQTDVEERARRDRVVRARVEQLNPSVGTDLGWTTRVKQVLSVRGRDDDVVSWGDEIALPEAIAPARPGGHTDWRVTIEEWEILPADGSTLQEEGREARLVYADHLPL